MTSFTANDKAKAKIDNRFKAIAIGTVLVFIEMAWTGHWYKLAINSGNFQFYYCFYILFLVYILVAVFSFMPQKLNRIIHSIVLVNDTFTGTTFPFDIKYYPYKLKTIKFDMKKDDVVYRKLSLELNGLINNLPFTKSHAIKYKGVDYYRVPSLFNDSNNVIEAIAAHT